MNERCVFFHIYTVTLSEIPFRNESKAYTRVANMFSFRYAALTIVLVQIVLAAPNQPNIPISPQTIAPLISSFLGATIRLVYKSGVLIRSANSQNDERTAKWVSQVTVSGDVEALIRAANGELENFFVDVDRIIDQTYDQIEYLFDQFENQVRSDVRCRNDLLDVNHTLNVIHNLIWTLETCIKEYVVRVKSTFRLIVNQAYDGGRQAHAAAINGYDIQLAQKHMDEALKTGVDRSNQLLDIAGAAIVKEIARATAVLQQWALRL